MSNKEFLVRVEPPTFCFVEGSSTIRKNIEQLKQCCVEHLITLLQKESPQLQLRYDVATRQSSRNVFIMGGFSGVCMCVVFFYLFFIFFSNPLESNFKSALSYTFISIC